MEILRASHLCKTYGKGENEVRALDDVSFSIEKGEFVAIVGTIAFVMKIVQKSFFPAIPVTT